MASPEEMKTPKERVSDTVQPATKSHKPLWRRTVRWCMALIGIVAVLFLLVCSLVVMILSPQRLTPLVEKHASEFLDAEVTAGRVELTFWHTFPRMTLEVDSLCVVSRSLRSLPDSVRRALPADADSLLSLASFRGGVNVAALLAGNVSLYDVEFNSPRVNLVQVDGNSANYLIMPESAPSDSSSTGYVPGISINRFTIRDAAPLRFRSLRDSTDMAVSIRNVDLTGDKAPEYTLGLNGNLHSPLLDEFDLNNLRIGAQGGIRWDSDEPMALAVRDFLLEADSMQVRLNSEMDFSGDPVVSSFAVSAEGIKVSDLIGHIPAGMRGIAGRMSTDMVISADLRLTRPWHPADTVLPSVECGVRIPACRFDYENIRLHRLAAEFHADFNGTDIDASVFTLRSLEAEGRSVSVSLKADATDVGTDALLRGRFSGSVSLACLPSALRRQVGVLRGGVLEGNTDFRFRLSDFTRENFHRMYAMGKFRVRNLDADLYEFGRVYMRDAQIDFGSNKSFVSDAGKIDSLLTVSLKVDTASAIGQGIALELRNFRGGAGTANRRGSADTTEINPFGMTFALDRLNFSSAADSMRMRLRHASVGGALRRYRGDARLPQLDLKLALEGLLFGQARSRVALREADADLSLHMRPRPGSSLTAGQRAARRKAMADSLAALPAQPMNHMLDSAELRFLRRWDVEGNVHAKAGTLVTPSFPLRNRLSDIDLHFTQDSIRLRTLSYRAGHSDFHVSGTVSNLRRALTARRNNILGLELNVTSDTVDVNEIVNALLAGGAIVSEPDSTLVWEEEAPDTYGHTAGDSVSRPLLVPQNIDARMAVSAGHIIYSDLEMHDFKGGLMVYDGAVNLRNLSASTDIGSLSLDALYSGAEPDSLQFGLGMKVSRFRLDRLTSLVPAIDSLMPLMKNFAGIVNADVAVTADIEPNMDIDIASLRAVMKIEGDSLVLLDPDTFRTLSKWLMFRDKKNNMISHMAAEAVIENSAIELYPFMFDIDRYRLGVMGHNDLAMNLNYHVSVLKSPVPFRFGINIKGTPDDMKIRLGGARFKEKMVGERQAIADNTRVNIVRQIDNVFRRGISKARLGGLSFRDAGNRPAETHQAILDDFDRETMSYSDSLQFIRQGLIENPDTLRFPLQNPMEAGSR